MNITTNLVFHLVFDVIIIPMMFLSTTLIIGWTVYFAVQCWRLYRQYRICKLAPVLHPLYSGVQELSKQRKLYNFRTHIGKYILMIVCSFVEVASMVIGGIISILKSTQHRHPNITKNKIEDLQCFNYHWFLQNFHSPAVLVVNNISLLLSVHLLILIAILSRYLVARYLNHSFKRTLIKYLIWCSIQCILVVFCSTPYTWIFLVPIIPIIILANWILLVRDTYILSRVLRSNLRDILLYTNNNAFYNQQLTAYTFYRIFRILSLVSLFFYALCVIEFLISQFLKYLIFAPCYIHFKHTSILLFLESNDQYFAKHILSLIDAIFQFIYCITLSLPLYAVTFIPVILKFVKRCREKEDQYRYNYEKLEPLIKKYL